MLKEYNGSFYIIVGTIAFLAIAFAFPPIIPREGLPAPKPLVQSVANDEHSFCLTNLSDVNCSCFAHKSAHILTRDQPEIPGFTYTNRSLLARDQASNAC